MFYRCARPGLILAHGAVGDQAPLTVTRLDHVVKRRSLVKTRTRRPRGWGCRLGICTNTVQRNHFAQIRCTILAGGYLQPQGGVSQECMMERGALCVQALIWYTRFEYSRICVCTSTVQWAPVEQRYRGTRRRNTLLNRPPAQARCRVSHSRNALLNLPPAQTRCRASQHVYSHCASGIFMALRHGMNRHGADNAAERIRH